MMGVDRLGTFGIAGTSSLDVDYETLDENMLDGAEDFALTDLSGDTGFEASDAFEFEFEEWNVGELSPAGQTFSFDGSSLEYGAEAFLVDDQDTPTFSFASSGESADLRELLDSSEWQPSSGSSFMSGDVDVDTFGIDDESEVRFTSLSGEKAMQQAVPFLPGSAENDARQGGSEAVGGPPLDVPDAPVNAEAQGKLPPPPPVAGSAGKEGSPEVLAAGVSVGPLLQKALNRMSDPKVREAIEKALPFLKQAGSGAQRFGNNERIREIAALFSNTALSTDAAALIETIGGSDTTDPYEYLIGLATDSLAPLEGEQRVSVHSENLIVENARLRTSAASDDLLQNEINVEIHAIGADAHERERDQATNTERGELLALGRAGKEEQWYQDQFKALTDMGYDFEGKTPQSYEEAERLGFFGKDGLINPSRTGVFVSNDSIYEPFSETQSIFGIPDVTQIADFPDEIPAETFVTGVQRPTYEAVRAELEEKGVIDADTTYIHPADFADALGDLTGVEIGGKALDIAIEQQNRQLGDQLLALGVAEVYGGLNMADTGAFAERAGPEQFAHNTTALAFLQDDIDRLVKALPDDPELQNTLVNALHDGTVQALGEALPDDYLIAKSVYAPRSVTFEPGSAEANFFALTRQIDAAVRDSAPEAKIDKMLGDLAGRHTRLFGPPAGKEYAESIDEERIRANSPSVVPSFEKLGVSLSPGTAVDMRYTQLFRNAVNTAWKGNFHLHSSSLDGLATTRHDIDADVVRHTVGALADKITRVQDAQIERATEANLERRRANGETVRSNEQTALDVRADIRLANDVLGLSEINPYWLEQTVLRGSLNSDRPTGFEDPLAHARRQLELMRTTTVQDLVPASDDTRTLEEVYHDARGGEKLTPAAMADSPTPQDFPFARDAKNATGWYVPPDLASEIVENSLDYVAFEDGAELLAFRPLHFEPSTLLLEGSTEEIITEANRLAEDFASRAGFEDTAAIIGQPIKVPTDILRTARVADGVLQVERDIAQRIGSIDTRPLGSDLAGGFAFPHYQAIEQVSNEAQGLKRSLSQWKLALGEHDPRAEAALDHVLDGTPLDPNNPFHDFLVRGLPLEAAGDRLRGVAPISVFSEYDSLRVSGSEPRASTVIETEPQLLMAGAGNWIEAVLEGLKGGTNAGFDTEFKLDTLSLHGSLGAFNGNDPDPGISPHTPAAFFADQVNAEVALALLGQDQGRVDARNTAAQVTREQLNAANAAAADVDNAGFLNGLYQQHQDLRPAVVRIEQAQLLRGDLRSDEWQSSQLQWIDAIIAKPELAGLNARQVKALEHVREEARHDKDVIGYGEHQTFVTSGPGGIGAGFDVYGGNPDEFAPYSQAEIDTAAASVGQVDVPADVVARTGTPLTALDFAGLKPAEARKLAEETYRANVDPGGNGKPGDRFAFIEEGASGAAAYNAAIKVDGHITAMANNHTAGVDLSNPKLARNRSVVVQEGRAETILMSLEHPGIAVKLTSGRALDKQERSIVEQRYPVVDMVFNDQERLKQGLGTTDIEIWKQNASAAANNVGQGVAGVSPATTSTLERLDTSIRELVADGDAYRGGLAKLHGVDRFVDPSVQAATREEDSKAFNRTVVKNEKILAENAADTQAAADVRNRAERQNVELVPLQTSFSFKGEPLKVVTPNSLEQQQLLELSSAELAEGEAAAAQIVASHGGVDRTLDKLPVLTGLVDAQLALGRPFLDIDKGILYFPEPAYQAIREGEKHPDFISGDVGKNGQASPQSTTSGPSRLGKQAIEQDPIITAQRYQEGFNELLGKWRVQIQAAADRMPDSDDQTSLWQEWNKVVIGVRNDEGLFKAVVDAYRGKSVAPRYANLPILDGFVDDQQALNEAALNVGNGTYNLRMRSRADTDEAIDGVNGAGVVPGTDTLWLRNPRTRGLLDGKDAVPFELDITPGEQLLERFNPFSLINPNAGAAHAVTAPPMPKTPVAPSSLWPPAGGKPASGGQGKPLKISGDAVINSYEQWSAIVAGESNNARKQPLPTIATELAALALDDSVQVGIEQGLVLDRQLAERDHLVAQAENLDRQAFSIDESVRVVSLDQGTDWRRTELMQSEIPESALIPLEQKQSARGPRQQELQTQHRYPGTDKTVEEVLDILHPDGVPEGVVLPWIDAGTGQVYVSSRQAAEVRATLPEFAYVDRPTILAQKPFTPVTPVSPEAVSTVGNNVNLHGSHSKELDLEATMLEVTDNAQNAVAQQLKPNQAAQLRRVREGDLRLFREHDAAPRALAAAQAADGTYEGKTVDDYLAELPFEVEQALDKYIGRRYTIAEQWGVRLPDTLTKDERDHAATFGGLDFRWTRAPLNRQSLFVLAEDFQLSTESEVIERVDTATIGYGESTQAFLELINGRNDVAVTLNRQTLAEAEQHQNDARARISEVNTARGATGTQIDAYAQGNENFTRQVAVHADLGKNLDSQEERELGWQMLVENGEIDPEKIPLEDYSYERHPIYRADDDRTYYPESWRTRQLGKPPAIEPSDLAGSSSEIPSLFDYQRAVDIIVPLDPDATIKNLEIALKADNILVAQGRDEQEIEQALAAEADHERRRIAIVTFGLIHGYAANEVLDADSATGGKRSPAASGRVLGVRAEAAFERFAADRGFLTGPAVEGQQAIYDYFGMLARNDKSGARTILDELDNDLLADRFADYLDGDLADFAQPTGTLPRS